jgi:hypothetical protein
VDEAAAVAEFKIRMTTKSLVLKRGYPSRRRDNDYEDVSDEQLPNGRMPVLLWLLL